MHLKKQVDYTVPQLEYILQYKHRIVYIIPTVLQWLL